MKRFLELINHKRARHVALAVAIAVVIVSSLLPVGVNTDADKRIVSIGISTAQAQNLIADEIKNATDRYTLSIVHNDIDGSFTKTVSNLPQYVEDVDHPIVCEWQTGGLHQYGITSHILISWVDNTAVTVLDQWEDRNTRGDLVSGTVKALSWDPVVYLSAKKQNPISVTATKLGADPVNSNYYGNTLEWVYPICTRHLRVTECGIYEYYIFTSNPGRDVTIKSNATGTLKPASPYAIDANGDPLTGFSVVGDTKTITAAGFSSAVYPVIVDDSVTVYSTSADGALTNIHTVYATCQAATTASEAVDNTGVTISVRNRYVTTPNYRIARGYIYFTPGLNAGDTVTGVVASFYAQEVNEIDAGHSDLCLYEGTQQDTLIQADFNNWGTTLLTAGTYSYEYPMSLVAYTDATLNAAGIALVHAGRAGTVKFCLRTLGDVSILTPTGNNRQIIYSNEQGAGFQPRLVITYTVPDISVSPTSKDFGVVAISSTPYTTTSYFTVTNDSLIQTDQTISVTTSTWSGGVTWTHSDTATAGENTAGLKANRGGTWGSGDIIVKYSSPNYIYENCPVSTGYSFGLKLIAPTGYTDGVAKQITVRITAVAG